MHKPCPILKLELVPGDAPRPVEQLDGDLLVPSAARPLIERALCMAEKALADEKKSERAALVVAKRLLGIEEVDTERQTLLTNLVKIRPI